MTRKRDYLYIAQVRLSHAVTGAITQKGEQHDVSHLTAAQLERALADGRLVAIAQPLPKRTTNDDADEPAQGDE